MTLAPGGRYRLGELTAGSSLAVKSRGGDRNFRRRAEGRAAAREAVGFSDLLGVAR